MNADFNDYWSEIAANYTRHRPQYPEDLFKYLAAVAPSRCRVWDAGTGGGQAAIRLVKYFKEVVATDASEEQIRNALVHPRVCYKVELSGQTTLRDGEFDLVTAAHSLHWFPVEDFYREVRRVLRKPNGVLAVWCYGLESVSDSVDSVIQKLHDDLLGSYWPKRTVEDHTYQDLYFPFNELPRRVFHMEMIWTLGQLLDSFRTWSATLFCKEDQRIDPLDVLANEFQAAWGDPDEPRLVTWPVYLRIAIVD